MSGMNDSHLRCAAVNNWMSVSQPWIKSTGNIRRNITDVASLKTSDMYDRGVISSTSPPAMAPALAPEGLQNQSRLRSLLTARRPPRADARHGKEIPKGLLKEQPTTNNTESNFLLKGLLNSGVMQQDDELLSSLGFSNVQSPPSRTPNSPLSPAFSPVHDQSPQSYNSPSPVGSLAGSSKRGGDDDIYIERQILKKTCYSPPSFHALPSSSVAAASKDASAIERSNKMLASLLAKQANTPATIPPLPESIIKATPQERLPKIPGRKRQNSTALWSGGTIQMNGAGPVSPPVVTSPKIEDYLPPASAATSVEHFKERYPVNTPPVTVGTAVQRPAENYPVVSPPVTTATPAQRPKETYPRIPQPVSAGPLVQLPKEAYSTLTTTPSPISISSSPDSEHCFPINQPRDEVPVIEQRSCAVSQQQQFRCTPEEAWSTFCRQRNQVSTTAAENSGAWDKQLTAQRVQAFQGQRESMACSTNYNAASTCQYNANLCSYDSYSQLQIRQNLKSSPELCLMQQRQLLFRQQQMLLHQQALTQTNYQEQLCAQQRESFAMQNQQLQQQFTGWNSYSRQQAAYNSFLEMKRNEASIPNFRGSNGSQSGNSYQEYWDLQNSDPMPSTRIPNSMIYQNRGETNNGTNYMRENLSDSNMLRERPSRLSGNEDVAVNPERLSNDDLQPLPQKSFNLNDTPLLLEPNDNDLSRILDDILDVEAPGKNDQDPRRLQRNNVFPIPNNGPTVHPNMFAYNNYNNFDAQSCV